MKENKLVTVRTDRKETVVGILHALDGPEFDFQLGALADSLDGRRKYYVTVGYYDEKDAEEEVQYVVPRVVVA